MSKRILPATVFRGAGLREAGQLTMQPVRRLFPGRPDQVACAREFVRQVLGSLPVVEEAVLLVSELSTNAVLHTVSGSGGTFEVTIRRDLRHARVEVHDQDSESVPRAQSADALTEVGRGISLVELVAARWGHTVDANGRSVFFELCWGETD